MNLSSGGAAAAGGASAVVFAYHNVGVRCLQVLLDAGVRIPLVVTHEDNPGENIWFDSVAELASRHGIPVITPDNPNTPEMLERLAALAASLANPVTGISFGTAQTNAVNHYLVVSRDLSEQRPDVSELRGEAQLRRRLPAAEPGDHR